MPSAIVEAVRERAADWAVLVTLAVVLAIVDFTVPVYERTIPTNDPTLMWPYLGYETVPTWLLTILAVILPLVFMVGISFARRLWRVDLQPMLLAFGFACLTTVLITDVIKLTAGRLRPDFYQRCQLVNGECTGDPDIVEYGRKSFVSGHASTAFAGLGFFSMYLAAKVHAFDRRGRLWKVTLVLVPLVGAYLIAISRICNYVHHWQDVLVGGALGLALAMLAYRQYYPWPWGKGAELPYPDPDLDVPGTPQPLQAYRSTDETMRVV